MISSVASGSAADRRWPTRRASVARASAAEEFQTQRPGPGGDQTGQPVTAGDHGQTARGGGQQRTYVLGAGGVVEHDEDPAVRQQLAVEVRERGHVVREVPGRCSECRHQPAQRLHGFRRGPGGRVVAAQLDVELTVREPMCDLMGPVHDRRGLPDARHSADQDRPGRTGGRRRPGEGGQLPEFLTPTGEDRQAGRQLGGPGKGFHRFGQRCPDRSVRRGRGRAHLLTEDPGVGLAQLGARGDPQLRGQSAPYLLVRRQRLGLQSAGRQHHHEPGVQGLVQGLQFDGPAQARQHEARRAAQQGRVGRHPCGEHEFVLHGAEQGVRASRRGEPHRHRPAPLAEGPDELPYRHLGPTGGDRPPAPQGELAEPQQIDLVRLRVQEVGTGAARQTAAGRPGRQPRFEQPPQRTDVAAHHVRGAGRRTARPEHLHDLAHLHRPPRPHHEQPQEGALLREPQIEFPLGPPDPQRAQHLEPHHLDPHHLVELCHALGDMP